MLDQPVEYRVITWTHHDGITSTTDTMPLQDVERLASDLRSTNPAWLHIEVEPASS